MVNTHPNREPLALEHLLRQSFTAYCPRISKRIRHARRNSEVLRPLFPGYLFVRIDGAPWRPILSTVGVRSLVRFGDCVGMLDDRFVAALQEREIGGVLHPPGRQFRLGQSVRVAAGPFEGLVAKVIELNDRERLSVLMDLLMRKVKVRLAESDVVAV